MDKFTVSVPEESDGIKIREFLKRRLNFSTALIAKVKFGGVLLNGTAVTMRAIVHSRDTIEIIFPEEKSENVEPIYAPIDVVYEDEYILAVNKPQNMPVHPSRGNHLITLGNAVAAYLGEPFVFRAVNRLDRDTSGIVIIAKDQYTASRLSDEMKSGGFEKYYAALLERLPEIPQGIIDAPIEREFPDTIKRVVREDGKRAITEYKVIDEYPDGRAICEIKLHTGRTHQIRVHFAHIGAPLYNDFLYGTRTDEDRTYSLACTKIVFSHPITNERLVISVERPF